MPRFESNPKKARINLKRHRISFEEAETIWRGPTLTELDEEHSDDEIRFTTFGISHKGKVLRVTHTEQDDLIRHGPKIIRIISARPADRRERRNYYESITGNARQR